MNYDRQLLSMSQEVQHWERLRMAVPYIAMEIQAQREKYRVLRDNMLMLVHDYNKVSGHVEGLDIHLHCTTCAGTCVRAHRHTGHMYRIPNRMLLSKMRRDACTDAHQRSRPVANYSRALLPGTLVVTVCCWCP
jgi:hypothetical protein